MILLWINVVDYPDRLLKRIADFMTIANAPWAQMRKCRLNTHAQ